MSLAAILFDLSRRLMPPGRAEWLDAMRAESDHLRGAERTRWAFGSLITALKQRFAPMDTGNYRVSRWVMLVETLGAFGPLTHAWWLASFDQPGILTLAPEVIERLYMHYPGSGFILTTCYVMAVVGLLGPIGLFLGLRYVLTGQGIRNRALGWALAAIPMVVYLSVGVMGYFVGPDDWRFDPLAGTTLLALLPAVVLWHLMAVAQPASSSPPTAAIAA